MQKRFKLPSTASESTIMAEQPEVVLQEKDCKGTMSLEQTDQKLTILGIFAHSHDFTHVAGTCAHHVEDGDSVTIVIASDGGNIHNELLWEELQKAPEQRDPKIVNESREAYVTRKTEELQKVCGLFGVKDVRVLPYADMPLKRTDELVEDLTEIICEVRPDILITERPIHLVPRRHRPAMSSEDHYVCAEVVSEAMMLAQCPRLGKNRIPHVPAQVFFRGVGCGPDDVSFVVDITDQLENRIKAEKLFLTQSLDTGGLAEKRIKSTAGFYGWYALVAYAEPFIRANPERGRKLTVMPFDLQESRESKLKHFKRVASK